MHIYFYITLKSLNIFILDLFPYSNFNIDFKENKI